MHTRERKSKMYGQQRGTSGCHVSSTKKQPLSSLGSGVGRSNNNLRHNQQPAFQQIDVPADNSCLFWAVTLAYLIPVKDNDVLFQQRYKALFGNQEDIMQRMNHAQSLVQSYNPFLERTINDNIFTELVSGTFRNRVVDHIAKNRNSFQSFIISDFDEYLETMKNSSTWGGEPEIRAMSEMLKVNIEVFGLIESQYKNGDIQIQLFHVNLPGIGEARNHYNYGLEQSVADHYYKKLMKHILKRSKNFHDRADLDYLANNLTNNIENNEVPLGRKTVEDIAKIKWYGKVSKVIFKVTSVGEIMDSQLLGQYRTELKKSENQEKSLAIMIDLGNLHWATLVIHYKDSQFHGYYVDCQGQELPDDIKNAWSQTNDDKNNGIIDCTIEKPRGKEFDSGMFAFKDAESIIKKLQDKVVNVKQIQKQLEQPSYYSDPLLKKDKKNFAKKLEEKGKMEDKIKVCSEILQKLEQIEEFSYKNVNIFLLFLEAIALADSSQLSEDYLNKFKDEIIGSKNSALAETIRNSLFTHSEYERVVKKSKLHEEMMKLVKNNISCENFFRKLKDYMSQVSSKLEKNGNDKLHALGDFLKTQNEIKEMHENKSFGEVLNGDQIYTELSKLFKDCIKQTGGKPNVAQGEEIMFNLIVNIIPNLLRMYPESRKLSAKGLEKIREFKNEFFHNFHAHGNSRLQRNFILKEGIRELLDYFFKYYFSQKVYEKFKNPSSLEHVVTNLLSDVQEGFKEGYLGEYDNVEPAILELTNEKVGGKPKLSCFIEYLKLILVVDNEYVAKEREMKRKKSKNQVINRELKAIDRKRIYKEFKGLTVKENGSDKLIKDLRKKLRTQHGIWIPTRYLKTMFEYYVKDDCPPSQFEEVFYNDIRALISFKDNYKLLTQNVIDIYEKFAKGEEISDLLDELKLPSQQKSSIKEKLCSLRSIKNRFIDLSLYFDVKNDKNKKIDVIVDTVKVIRNLLEMLDGHVLYPFLSMSVEEIFSNEIFLDYLLNEKISITSNFIIELLKIEYMTPYVVKLVMGNKLTPTIEQFSNIIQNLLEKDIYSEYLKELLEGVSNEKFLEILKDNGSNLDLANVKGEVYRQICNQISKGNIRNTYRLFKDPEHIAEILRALNNDARETKEILIQEAFKLLKLAVNELYNNEKYDLVLEFLSVKEVDDLKSVLLSKDSSNLDILQIERTMARIENKKGCYENALKIFERLKNVEFKDTEPNKLYLSLLASSDIAYTKHLSGEYEESYKEYKALYDNIIKQFTINGNVSKLSYAIYNDILKSEKYLSVLVLDSKYLNILKIRSDIAYEFGCLANAKHKSLPPKRSEDYKTKFNEILQDYQDALNIYEEVYEIKETNTARGQDIVKTMRGIAFVNERLAGLKSSSLKNEEMLNQALNHYNKAFKTYVMTLQIQEKGLWKTHCANLQTVQDILRTLRGIAHTHNKLGLLKRSSNPKEALQHHNEALRIYKKEVFKVQVKTLGEEHEYILNTMIDIAYTNNNLAKLKLKDNREEALKHYEKAIGMYDEVFKIQKKTLGEEHDKTKKTEADLVQTRTWMNNLN